MTPLALFIWLLIAATIVVVSRSKWSAWVSPDWRHELSNAVIAWIVLGVLAVALSGIYWFGGSFFWSQDRSAQAVPETQPAFLNVAGQSVTRNDSATTFGAVLVLVNFGELATVAELRVESLLDGKPLPVTQYAVPTKHDFGPGQQFNVTMSYNPGADIYAALLGGTQTYELHLRAVYPDGSDGTKQYFFRGRINLTGQTIETLESVTQPVTP